MQTHHNAGGFHILELFRHGRTVRTRLLWGVLFSSLPALFSFTAWLPAMLNGLGLSPPKIAGITGAAKGGGLIGWMIFARIILRVRPFLMAAAG